MAIVDTAYYDEITSTLRSLLIRLSDRLPREDQVLISEFIEANELGLALEQMADVLSEDDLPISSQDRADMLGLAERMQMDDRVPRALAFRPDV